MGPSICRLKLVSSKILKYEKLSLPLRLMMVHQDRPALFNCFPGCLIGISNLIYLTSPPPFAQLHSLLSFAHPESETTNLVALPSPIQPSRPSSTIHPLDSSHCCCDPGPCLPPRSLRWPPAWPPCFHSYFWPTIPSPESEALSTTALSTTVATKRKQRRSHGNMASSKWKVLSVQTIHCISET